MNEKELDELATDYGTDWRGEIFYGEVTAYRTGAFRILNLLKEYCDNNSFTTNGENMPVVDVHDLLGQFEDLLPKKD